MKFSKSEKIISFVVLTVLCGTAMVFLYLSLSGKQVLYEGKVKDPETRMENDPIMYIEEYNPLEESDFGDYGKRSNYGPDDIKPPKVDEDPRYVLYSKESFDAQTEGRRILYFYTGRVMECLDTEKEILENIDMIPNDVVIYRLDYDAEVKLRADYHIRYYDMFVEVDSNMGEINKWSAGGLEKMLRMLESNLLQ